MNKTRSGRKVRAVSVGVGILAFLLAFGAGVVSKFAIQPGWAKEYSIDDIRNLPVRELADKNCILFMWVTFPTLREAFSVIDAWGFTYKTVAFAWVKQNKKTSSLFWGMGYWTRANVELCLLATKGSPKRHSANVHQVVFAPIAEHSKKPDIIREKIVELAGDLPRIELFARQSPTGWDVWGNEVDCSIQFP